MDTNEFDGASGIVIEDPEAKRIAEKAAKRQRRKEKRKGRQKKKTLGTKRIRGEEIRPPGKRERKPHPIATRTAGASWGPKTRGHNRPNNRHLLKEQGQLVSA